MQENLISAILLGRGAASEVLLCRIILAGLFLAPCVLLGLALIGAWRDTPRYNRYGRRY